MSLHPRFRHLLAVLLFVMALGISMTPQRAFAAAQADQVTYNDEYIFPLTRGLNDMEMNPALKLPLFPVTIILDVALLPVGVIMGFFPKSESYDRGGY